MWDHAIARIRCPCCGGTVRQESLPASPAAASQGGEASGGGWIEAGAIFCDACRVPYPIYKSVPILLTYETPFSKTAIASWPEESRKAWLGAGFGLPTDPPPKGEQFVGASFSTEWANYEYGDTLWTAPIDDRLQTFRGECGLKKGDLIGKRFCEIGCGLGIMTNEASMTIGAEAWGMDLRTAVFHASQFLSNAMLRSGPAGIEP